MQNVHKLKKMFDISEMASVSNAEAILLLVITTPERIQERPLHTFTMGSIVQ